MVVFVYEKINLLAGLIAFLVKIIQLLHRPILFIHLFLQTCRKIVGINVTEEIELRIAMGIKRFTIVVELRINHRKIQIQNKI